MDCPLEPDDLILRNSSWVILVDEVDCIASTFLKPVAKRSGEGKSGAKASAPELKFKKVNCTIFLQMPEKIYKRAEAWIDKKAVCTWLVCSCS